MAKLLLAVLGLLILAAIAWKARQARVRAIRRDARRQTRARQDERWERRHRI